MPDSRWVGRNPFRHVGRACIGLLVFHAVAATTLAWGLATERGALVRNSLLIQGTSVQDFYWPPESPPPDFRSEVVQPPEIFLALADTLMADREPGETFDLEAAESLVRWLNRTPGDGFAIRADTESTYRLIVDEGWGYCADYVRVAMAIFHAFGVPVRHWGFGFGNLGGGHAFLEIFLEGFDNWIFIDPYYGFWIRSPETGQPLSGKAFRNALLDPNGQLPLVEPILEHFRELEDSEALLAFYGGGVDYFHLFWGNNLFQVESHPLTAGLSSFSRPAGILAAIGLGIHPPIRPLPAPTEAYSLALQEIRRIRLVLILAGMAALITGMWVLVELSRAVAGGWRARIASP